MSLTIAREVNAKHPHLLKENTGASCHMFTVHLIEHLRVAGFSAFLMCKTRGEGQYTPLGFQPRDVMGFDGKMYRVTGVSHDAIWCEGRQFDTIGSANDGDTPIFRPNGEQIVGVPVWNPIPQEYWRPNNPPLKMEPVVSPPLVPKQVPPSTQYPGDTWFIEQVGVPLEADYAQAGQRLNAGSATWFARTIFDAIAGAMTMDASVAKHRAEWRASLGLPPL